MGGDPVDRRARAPALRPGLTGRRPQFSGGDRYSKCPGSGTSQRLPSVNPHRANTATSRGSCTEARPVGLDPALRSIATPQAWRRDPRAAAGRAWVPAAGEPGGVDQPGEVRLDQLTEGAVERADHQPVATGGPDDRQLDGHEVLGLPGRVLLERVSGRRPVRELAEPRLDEHLRQHGVALAQERGLARAAEAHGAVGRQGGAQTLLEAGAVAAVCQQHVAVGRDTEPGTGRPVHGQLGAADGGVADHRGDRHRPSSRERQRAAGTESAQLGRGGAEQSLARPEPGHGLEIGPAEEGAVRGGVDRRGLERYRPPRGWGVDDRASRIAGLDQLHGAGGHDGGGPDIGVGGGGGRQRGVEAARCPRQQDGRSAGHRDRPRGARRRGRRGACGGSILNAGHGHRPSDHAGQRRDHDHRGKSGPPHAAGSSCSATAANSPRVRVSLRSEQTRPASTHPSSPSAGL